MRRGIVRRPFIESSESIESIEVTQSEPHQFNFNVTEANEVDDQVTTGAGTTPSNIDAQQQQNLTADELQQLFTQASSELVAESTDEQDFFKRDASIKAPKTSKIIQTPFPPPPSDRKEDLDVDIEQLKQLAKQEAGPLIIERYSPSQAQIDHSLATVTITFNQPMISVSSLDEIIDVENLGISLMPKLEGRWRWTGTKTVQFEPKYRLPYSTKYTLQVKKENCVSAIGGKSIRQHSSSSRDYIE